MNLFSNVSDNKRNVVALPQDLHPEMADVFTAESQTWMLLPVEEHVLDFKDVLSLSPSMYKAFSTFIKTIRKSQKRASSINMRPTILQQIIAAGLKDLFAPAQRELEGPYRKIDVAFINPFLSAVKEVFSTQVRIDIRPHKPFLAGSGNQPECAIVGLVALNCNQFRGNIALCFNADVFLKIYERMLGEKHETITCEIEDGVAELLNIIYGTAKTVLNREQGLDLKPALPTILTGEKITLRRSPDSQVLILPFESDAGLFHVEIARTLSNETQKRSA